MNRLLDPSFVRERGKKASISYYEERIKALKDRHLDLQLVPSTATHPKEGEMVKQELDKMKKILSTLKGEIR